METPQEILQENATGAQAAARYFAYIAYDGTAYHGWQIQPNADSVQQRVNAALSTLLREEVAVTGAGRTDTGVHAAMMAAHFDHSPGLDTEWLCARLNRVLPRDISVTRIVRVNPKAHARFDATARTYHYHVYTRKDPFLRHFAARLVYTPDFRLMNETARLLLDTSDFTSFSKVHTDTKTNICRLTRAEWVEAAPGLWRFEITADRFLRNMVRAVVGTLLDVGRGKITPKEFKDIIDSHDRCSAGDSVPAKALSLVDIKYPDWVFRY